MKIKNLILRANSILEKSNIENSNLKVKMILSNLLNKTKEHLIIYGEEEISENIIQEFENKLEKLKENMPIQYIINNQEFYGLNFYVDENVLIPQPDTEILVEECISIAKNNLKDIKKNIKILDLCTGSGVIGVSLAKNIEESEIILSDISEKALEIARKNVEMNNVKIKIINSDLFKNINEKFDIIVSNPPYIETKTIASLSEEVKKEPILALDGGEDGLDFYRKIAKEARNYLTPCGYLALEIGYNQKDSVEKILKQNNYSNIYSKKDLGGNDRIIIATI